MKNEIKSKLENMYSDLFRNADMEFTDFVKYRDESKIDKIVGCDMIYFSSICSHHLLPFSGYVWFYYIPDGFIIGASKIVRLIKHYSKRPQLQENLSDEILNCFVKNMKPLGAFICIRAKHSCMQCRGAESNNESGFVTLSSSGLIQINLHFQNRCFELMKLSLGIEK